jgi:L-rhamnonate dehydratase
MRVAQLETFHLGRSLWAELWEREKDLPLVSPLSGYPAYRHPYSTWYWDPGMTLVVLTDDEGRQGLGWTEDGTGAAGLMIERHLRRFVVGASPFDVERVWDVMYRASIPYGRAGAAIEAISALDIALWDLMGHATGKPVYVLLGGAVREHVRLYASALRPIGPDRVAAEVRAYVAAGYTAVKGRFPAGPADGPRGRRGVRRLHGVGRDLREGDVPDARALRAGVDRGAGHPRRRRGVRAHPPRDGDPDLRRRA